MRKWPMVKLGEVIRKTKQLDPRKHSDDVFLLYSIPAYDEGAPEKCQGHSIGSSKTVLLPGDVLLSKIVPHIRRSWVVSEHDHRVLGSSEWIVFSDDRFDPKYLRQYLLSDPFHQQFMTTVAGVGGSLNRARPAAVARLKIPLPPLEEQKRIAGILEASAWQLEKVQTALDSLRQMRSSLIEEYCATSEVTVNLDSLASVTGGLSLSGKRAVNPIECEYLRVANIQRNRFLIDDVKTIRCTEKELDRCLVNDGDILMLEANANPYEVGRAAIAETFGRHFVFQNHLFRIRPVGISSIVLNALLESTFVRAQLLRVVKTTSGLNTMTINQARNLRVPQRAPAKNHRFNTQLELLSSQARNLEEKQNLLQELHQSLVARAFTGAL